MRGRAQSMKKRHASAAAKRIRKHPVIHCRKKNIRDRLFVFSFPNGIRRKIFIANIKNDRTENSCNIVSKQQVLMLYSCFWLVIGLMSELSKFPRHRRILQPSSHEVCSFELPNDPFFGIIRSQSYPEKRITVQILSFIALFIMISAK